MANLKILRVNIDDKTTELKLFSNDDAAVVLPDLRENLAKVQRQLRLMVTTINDDDTEEVIAEKVAVMATEKAELINAVNETLYTAFSPDVSLVDIAKAIATPESFPYRLPNGIRMTVDFEVMPLIDTSDIISMDSLFAGCSQLVSFSQSKLQTAQATSMEEMFSKCSQLKIIPELDLSSCENMRNMFSKCTSVEEIHIVGTIRATEYAYRLQFGSLGKLKIVSIEDTSKVTNMEYMFYECTSLETIPPLDTSNVTDMRYMFSGCTSLETIPPLDTSNVTNMESMFRRGGFRRIEQIDVKSLTSASSMFEENAVTVSKVQYLKILNLGTTDTPIDFSYLVNWGYSTTENRQSLVDSLLTYSCDRVAAGKSAMTVKLHQKAYKRLTSDQRALIISKGYTLTY